MALRIDRLHLQNAVRHPCRRQFLGLFHRASGPPFHQFPGLPFTALRAHRIPLAAALGGCIPGRADLLDDLLGQRRRDGPGGCRAGQAGGLIDQQPALLPDVGLHLAVGLIVGLDHGAEGDALGGVFQVQAGAHVPSVFLTGLPQGVGQAGAIDERGGAANGLPGLIGRRDGRRAFLAHVVGDDQCRAGRRAQGREGRPHELPGGRVCVHVRQDESL